MKILFCTSGLITGRGGIASYAHDFIEAFKAGNEFVVVTNDGYVRKDSDPFEVIRFDMNDFSLNNAKRFMAFISDMNPQLIVNSAFPLLSLITPYIDDEIRVINVAHFVDGKLLMIAGVNANYADMSVVMSTYAENNLRRLYHVGGETRTEVIYNFMPPLCHIDFDIKKRQRPIKIVFPGGNSIAKSTDIICMVLKKLLQTDLEFEFYWLGQTQLPGAKWPFVRTKNIYDCFDKKDKRLKICGPVSREDSKRILSETNIFLLPSRGEGCPITLIEAMRGACIPIVSDARHGSLDIIQDGVCGLAVKQNSVKEIVNKICSIITSPSDYEYIYEASLKRYEELLQYDVWVGNMRRIIYGERHHRKRRQVNIKKYIIDAMYLKLRYFLFWIQARFCFQPYIMLIFRYIRYIYK